jgi:MarR family transcriptional regulator, organic hydroperoxide resistance regulator
LTRAGRGADPTGRAAEPDAQGAIFLRLGKAYNASTQAFEALTGLGAPRWRLLFLAHLQPGLSQKEITAQVRVDPGAITRQLHALEDAGLIARRDDARDTRLTRIHLTRRGQSLVRSVLRQREEFLQQMTAGIAQADLVRAMTVLERIAANLGDHEPLPQARSRHRVLRSGVGRPIPIESS